MHRNRFFPLALLVLIAACTPLTPPESTCADGIRNEGEEAVDCGPNCVPCPTCSDSIKNGFETRIDCGGPACPACFDCFDGQQNGQETGIDCGGPLCPVCPTCNDGVKNQNEQDVDCGGPCPFCQTCTDGILNQDETATDCGGTHCAACHCFDGIQNEGEYAIDCGAGCNPCTTTSFPCQLTEGKWLVAKNGEPASALLILTNRIYFFIDPDSIIIESYLQGIACSLVFNMHTPIFLPVGKYINYPVVSKSAGKILATPYITASIVVDGTRYESDSNLNYITLLSNPTGEVNFHSCNLLLTHATDTLSLSFRAKILY